MSEHIWSQENLAAFVVGGLSAEEVERLQRHAAECQECARALGETERMDRGLATLFVNSRPDGMMENRMNQAVRTAVASDRLRRRRLWKIVGGAAAAAILGLTGAAASQGFGDKQLRFPGDTSFTSKSFFLRDVRAAQEIGSMNESLSGKQAIENGETTYGPQKKIVIVDASSSMSSDDIFTPADAAEHLAKAIRTPGFSVIADSPTKVIVVDNGRPAKVEEQSKSEPVETKKGKTYDFVMEKKQWSQVFDFLTDKTEMPFIGPNIPTGTFTFIPPKDKKYNLGEIIDIINDALLCQPENAKWLLIRRAHSFTVIPADQKPDQSIIRLVNVEDLPNCGRTEMVRVQTNVVGVSVDDVAPTLEKSMSQYGKVLPIAESNTLIMTDTAGSLQQVLDILKSIEKGGSDAAQYSHVCKYIPARDAEKVLNDLLGGNQGGGFNGGSGGGFAMDPRFGGGGGRQPRVAKPTTITSNELLNTVYVNGPADKVSQARRVVESMDKGEHEFVVGSPKLVTYSVPVGTADTVVKMLTDKYTNTSVKISSAPGDSAVTVMAPEGTQKEIEQYVKGTSSSKKVEMVTLSTEDSTEIATRLQKMFGESKSGSPYIEAMTQTNAIAIHGTEAQIKDVKAALATLTQTPSRTTNLNAPSDPISDAAARRVIRSGEIEFEVDSFDSAVATAQGLVAKIKGGFVATVNSEKLPNGKVKGSLVVRLPPDALDGFLLDLRRDLGKNGELKGQKIGSEDITKKYTDLESRLKASRTMEQRLLQVIKEGKGEIKQLLEVEKELGEWRMKIEKDEGEMRYQSNLVALSTLTVTLAEREIRAAADVVQTERVQAGIEVEDVVKARDEVMTAVATAKGRVTKSELKQHSEGQFNATLNFEVAPESAGPLRDRLKQVGRVARLEIDFLQKAEGGIDPGPSAKVKRGDTQFLVQIYNLTNVAARETATLQLAATDVNASYRSLQNAVAKANGRILTARLDEQDRRNVKGQLDVEVRRSEEDALAAALTAAGDLLSRNVLRAEASENVTDSKVLYKVSLTSAAAIPARETTTLAIEVSDVTAATGVFAAQVSEAKGRIVESSEARERNGKITAKLVYDVPLSAESALVEKFKSAGVVRVQQVARNAQASDGPLAVARIEVTLANGDLLVPADDGLWAQTRKGLSLSLTVLLWSVSWLVVGLCVVLPWALIAYGGYRIVRRLRPATQPVTTTPT